MSLRLLTFFGVCLLAACSTQDAMPTAQEGEALFATNCAACHGYRGEGGELVGGQSAPDLTMIAARNDGVFPRAYVLSRIDGYEHREMSGQVMPEFGAMMLDPEMVPLVVDGVQTPTPRPMVALMLYLEEIQVSE
ncbi:c-type cytochrome [Lutimaribacter marinistellae]|uniref:C-type cytochrome n=1 Tax=Lutimaribacter marinistellae TaxID=1820329 RepID=A0ABV7TJW1_9RHOB